LVSAASLEAILPGLNPKTMLTAAFLKLSLVYRQVCLMNYLLHEGKLKSVNRLLLSSYKLY